MGNTNTRDQSDSNQTRKDAGNQSGQDDTSMRQQASGKNDASMGKGAGNQGQQGSSGQGKQGSSDQGRQDSNR